MVHSHRRAGFADAPALSPVYRWDIFKDCFLQAALEISEDKAMAGGTPANPATLAMEVTAPQRLRRWPHSTQKLCRPRL
jgi:hypothetical protein